MMMTKIQIQAKIQTQILLGKNWSLKGSDIFGMNYICGTKITVPPDILICSWKPFQISFLIASKDKYKKTKTKTKITVPPCYYWLLEALPDLLSSCEQTFPRSFPPWRVHGQWQDRQGLDFFSELPS